LLFLCFLVPPQNLVMTLLEFHTVDSFDDYSICTGVFVYLLIFLYFLWICFYLN
jgi:hypothetical protein